MNDMWAELEEELTKIIGQSIGERWEDVSVPLKKIVLYAARNIDNYHTRERIRQTIDKLLVQAITNRIAQEYETVFSDEITEIARMETKAKILRRRTRAMKALKKVEIEAIELDIICNVDNVQQIRMED